MRDEERANNLETFDPSLLRFATSIDIVVTPRFWNFKSVEWNPGVQAMNQDNLRGLSTKVNVANTPK